MSRYIDVDDLVKTIRKNWVAHRDDICQKTLDEVPTADVQEVKHAHWEKENEYFTVCSNCEEIALADHSYILSNYCPNCGAKMDEVTE